jgi:hypothetical protein
MRAFVVLALVAALPMGAFAPVAETRSSDEQVRQLAVALQWANVNGQYGKVWARLHPVHQRVTTRTFWESCRRKQAAKDSQVEWLSFRATDAHDDRLPFPLLGTLNVTAVTITTTFKDPLGSRHTIRGATYWIKVGADAKYRRLWRREEYRAYSAHRCPPSS